MSEINLNLVQNVSKDGSNSDGKKKETAKEEEKKLLEEKEVDIFSSANESEALTEEDIQDLVEEYVETLKQTASSDVSEKYDDYVKKFDVAAFMEKYPSATQADVRMFIWNETKDFE